jgi:hypothetical protein
MIQNRAQITWSGKVAREILVSIYHILKDGCTYNELGADHYDKINPDMIKRQMARRLTSMGYSVTLEPTESAA